MGLDDCITVALRSRFSLPDVGRAVHLMEQRLGERVVTEETVLATAELAQLAGYRSLSRFVDTVIAPRHI